MANKSNIVRLKRYSDNAKKVYSGLRFDIYQWRQKQFDGSFATYEIAKRSDTVVVVPVIGDRVVLVREKQPHWEKAGLTLVAGMINRDESPETAARRELEEETGLVFKDFHLVYVDTSAPAIEWFAYTFVATGFITTKPKKLDPGEQNKVVKVETSKLIDITRKKQMFYRPRWLEDFLIAGKPNQLRQALMNPARFEIKI